jgi:hypothetical protein
VRAGLFTLISFICTLSTSPMHQGDGMWCPTRRRALPAAGQAIPPGNGALCAGRHLRRGNVTCTVTCNLPSADLARVRPGGLLLSVRQLSGGATGPCPALKGLAFGASRWQSAAAE